PVVVVDEPDAGLVELIEQAHRFKLVARQSVVRRHHDDVDGLGADPVHYALQAGPPVLAQDTGLRLVTELAGQAPVRVPRDEPPRVFELPLDRRLGAPRGFVRIAFPPVCDHLQRRDHRLSASPFAAGAVQFGARLRRVYPFATSSVLPPASSPRAMSARASTTRARTA